MLLADPIGVKHSFFGEKGSVWVSETISELTTNMLRTTQPARRIFHVQLSKKTYMVWIQRQFIM